jgi:hypothetical protein
VDWFVSGVSTSMKLAKQTVNKSSSGIGVQLKLFVNKVNNLDLKTFLVRV